MMEEEEVWRLLLLPFDLTPRTAYTVRRWVASHFEDL